MSLAAGEVGMCVATLLRDPLRCDRAAFRAIARATAEAGFREISLWSLHEQAIGADAVAAELAETGLRVPVVEAALRWVDGDAADARAEADAMIAAAERFGAATLAACMLEPKLASPERAVQGFAALCERAARAGLRVSLEFLPWSGIPDLATAWQIVERAGAGNGALLLDTWHWQRQPGGPDPALLRRIPGDRIAYLQLCDTASEAQPDLLAEAMSDRRLPGEGTVDFAEVFALLGEIGARPFVAAEIFNAGLVAGGIDRAAQAMRRACSALTAA